MKLKKRIFESTWREFQFDFKFWDRKGYVLMTFYLYIKLGFLESKIWEISSPLNSFSVHFIFQQAKTSEWAPPHDGYVLSLQNILFNTLVEEKASLFVLGSIMLDFLVCFLLDEAGTLRLLLGHPLSVEKRQVNPSWTLWLPFLSQQASARRDVREIQERWLSPH